MKNLTSIIYLVLITSIIIFSSCNKDTDTPEPNSTTNNNSNSTTEQVVSEEGCGCLDSLTTNQELDVFNNSNIGTYGMKIELFGYWDVIGFSKLEGSETWEDYDFYKKALFDYNNGETTISLLTRYNDWEKYYNATSDKDYSEYQIQAMIDQNGDDQYQIHILDTFVYDKIFFCSEDVLYIKQVSSFDGTIYVNKFTRI